MLTKVYSSALRGVDAVEVEVSARATDKPLVIIVGLPDAAVRESSQRVTSALGNSCLRWENGVNTINLAPAPASIRSRWRSRGTDLRRCRRCLDHRHTIASQPSSHAGR